MCKEDLLQSRKNTLTGKCAAKFEKLLLLKQKQALAVGLFPTGIA